MQLSSKSTWYLDNSKHSGDRVFTQNSSSQFQMDFLLDGMSGKSGIQASEIAYTRLSKVTSKQELKTSLDELNTILVLNNYGTTLSVLVYNKESVEMYSSGDSPIFRLRNKQIEQLNTNYDESILLQTYLGKKEISIEDKTFDLQQGDVFFLCSDGIYDNLFKKRLEIILQGKTPLKIKQNLVSTLLERKKELRHRFKLDDRSAIIRMF